MEFTDLIVGAQKLVEVFGSWPSFHDAEVLWVRLERKSHGEGHRPTLEVLVHTFEMTNEVDSDGYYVLRDHVLVHLLFLDLVELRLDGFNHQNALMGLTLTDLPDRQLERIRFEVRFDSAHGLDASFKCHAVEVVSVISCTKGGEPI